MNQTLIKYKTKTFAIEDLNIFKAKAYEWATTYACFCFLDSNEHKDDQHQQYEALVGVGAQADIFATQHGDDFERLKEFYEERKDWLFGYFAYDLKNKIEKLDSKNTDQVQLPSLHFFQPKTVLEIKDQQVKISSLDESPTGLLKKINGTALPDSSSITSFEETAVQARISKSKYLETIEKIRQHIIEGDLYEMNFCQEFFIEQADIQPSILFQALNEIAKAPFTAFYKNNDHYLLCASPERFLQKNGQQIISQPIKGTRKRGRTQKQDEVLRQELFHAEKDRAENVMIVDLVRNDLSKNCDAGSVKVDELFGIYTFEQVHHMISTISGTLSEDIHFIDLIKGAFPMGSMTGAPKVMSMELIEKYEMTKRGLYSGAIGYIKPNGDFDFNVVIRSMIYNAAKKYLSFQVGGAIVYDSSPEDEFEESLLKAKGMLRALGV